ncbi:MAG: glycosyltransferase [Candidatus Krumholzibacteria bacterium]|nr:glycosyltransferase [Candidatus Krumholzibacteria bacterium]MDH4336382.1 glycosyltransferase [Candidatus Krumholzibacteria bacterium]MDH5269507.1 glycosyltransferase [Candidatus Krumholzibacteria bacterium]
MSWLRVLMVDSERSWRGGQEQVRLLMKGLVAEGAAVTLAAPPEGALFERAAALDVDRIAWNGRATGLGALRRAMASGRFDIVHSHASRAHGAVSAARVGLAARPPHVVSRRVDFPVGKGLPGRWKYRRGADAYIAISRQVREVLISGGVPPASIDVVPSGIDLDKFARGREATAVRAEFGLDGATRVVGNIAALAPHKSQSDLLRAAGHVLATRDDVRFFVVGEGALRADLERLAGSLGIAGRVVFTGFRPDALDLLRMFDVFVMSSYLEGLGTSIMDAQAVGIPVVATRTGGIPEIVEDGESGLLVPPRSPDLLAAAILRMLDDETLREACIRGGRERSHGYDYRNTVYKTLDVYRRLCHANHPPGEKDAIR